MASEDVKVTAEKPTVTIVRKLLKVKMDGTKPCFQEDCIILVDDDGAEYLLKARTS